MKQILASIIMICLSTQVLLSQSKFGVEIKGSGHISSNMGDVTIGNSQSDNILTNERNSSTYNYSVGVFFRFYERHCIKLHIGKHQNGVIYDLDYYSSQTGSVMEYKNVDLPFEYDQISPSYTYRILNKRLIIPIEIGLNINRVDFESMRFVYIKEYNYDIKIALGLHYKLFDKMSIGLNGQYIRGIMGYNSYPSRNLFNPEQIGLELSIQYEF